MATARALDSTAENPPAVVLPRSELPTLAELEKQHILAALEHCKGNRTHTAKLLDVSIRTLRNKLHEYHGTAPKSGQSGTTALG
jgi:DNA-binding NtrC family response regulator